MSTATAVKTDPTLREAVELAREAAASVAEVGTVGEHLGMEMVDERLATHYFACSATSYRGWRWAVSVARVSRSKTVTVCETDLVPGEGALLSPSWVPYASRLAPGDLGPGDVTPYLDADPKDPSNPGFAAFGHVLEGMLVAQEILGMPTDPNKGVGAMKGEMLKKPVKIISIRRVPAGA